MPALSITKRWSNRASLASIVAPANAERPPSVTCHGANRPGPGISTMPPAIVTVSSVAGTLVPSQSEASVHRPLPPFQLSRAIRSPRALRAKVESKPE